MHIETFFEHHQIRENPFAAEEARLDPVFERLLGEDPHHPDFDKILGRVDRPATAIVFGEKGSGKTAIRLALARRIERHNAEHPQARILTVVYDDLNPVLDRLQQARRQNAEAVLADFDLVTHQDAMLSLAVTRLVHALLAEDLDTLEGTGGPVPLPVELGRKQIRQIPRQRRGDLALLAALYDQPRSGAVAARLERLRRRLELGRPAPPWLALQCAAVLAALGLIGSAAAALIEPDTRPWWLWPGVGALAAAALLLTGRWLWRSWRTFWLSRRLARQMPAIGRGARQLRELLRGFRAGELAGRPLPEDAAAGTTAGDSRYQLTRRLIDVLASFDYQGMIVLVDRIDEPTIVSGDPQRMRSLVWPMLDNKFLKQDRLGLKLLLPLELKHLLLRESSVFFQEARLDKQSLIDRLTWSGPTLYDLANRRLNSCRPAGSEPIRLRDLFAPEVSRELLIEALDQMQQPRDAFKLLYAVIQEHCRLTTEEEPVFQVPRLTLESVRRVQVQRLQELHRGLAPA